MSFVRTLATLAVGFAAAKGLEQFQNMGGGAGLARSMKSTSLKGDIGTQIAGLLTRMQVPGGGEALKSNVNWLGATARAAGDGAMMGMGGLMAALGGAAWAGSGPARDLMGALGSGDLPGVNMERNARLMIRAMIQAARADGEIDAEERARLMQVLGDMSEDERAFVEAEMARPIDPKALAAEADPHQRTQLYAVSVVVSRIDNPAEIAYLDNLAAALHLGRAARQRVHQAMRIPQVLGEQGPSEPA